MEKIKIRAKAIKEIFVSDDNTFRITAVVDLDTGKKYTVKGEYPEIIEKLVHNISGYEFYNTERDQYEITKPDVEMEIPASERDKLVYLQTLTSYDKAVEILREDPDFITKILRNEEIDFSKMYNVGKKTIETLTRKIGDTHSIYRFRSKLNNIFSMATTKEILTLKELHHWNDSELLEKLKTMPYSVLVGIPGKAFQSIDKELQRITVNEPRENWQAILPENLLVSTDRKLQATIYTLNRLIQEDKNTKVSFRHLVTTMVQGSGLVPRIDGIYDYDIKGILEQFQSVFYFEPISTGTDYWVSTQEIYKHEKYIAEIINKAIKEENEWVDQYGKPINISEFSEIEIVKNGETLYVNLTDSQLSILDKIVKNKVTLLAGYAGTGKTTTVQAIIKLCDKYRKKYMLVAPTGKAAKVLSKSTRRNATTIHKAIKAIPTGGNQYMLIDEDEILDTELIIVDETSMVDINIFYYLLKKIDFNKTKLLVIGDDAQLPSIAAGNLFYDLKTYSEMDKVVLDKILRTSETNNINLVAQEIRLNRYQAEDYYNKEGTYTLQPIAVEDSREYKKLIIKKYQELLEKGNRPEDIMLLTGRRSEKFELNTKELNSLIQKIVTGTQYPRVSQAPRKDGKELPEYHINDIIMMTRNNYQTLTFANGEYESYFKQREKQLSRYNLEEDDPFGLGAMLQADSSTMTREKIKAGFLEEYLIDETFVANGEMGKIIENVNDGVIIYLEDSDKYIWIPELEYDDFELGYAITVHKAQGSQAKHIIYVSPQSHSYGMVSNLIYVAVTRAEEDCYHIGSPIALNNAVKYSAQLQRETFLSEMLKQETI